MTEKPYGDRPELDLSYTDRDGRHVPIKVTLPTPEQQVEWRRRAAEWQRAIDECTIYDRRGHDLDLVVFDEAFNLNRPHWLVGWLRQVDWLLLCALAALVVVVAVIVVGAL